MIAPGCRSRIAASGVVPGTISENTPSSRTRRAINCVYWLPKSRISTLPPGFVAAAATGFGAVAMRGISVPENPAVGEQHGNAEAIGLGDHVGILHRPAGLDDCAHAGCGRVRDAVGEREEAVARERGTVQVVPRALRLRDREVDRVHARGLAAAEPEHRLAARE